MFFFPHQNPIVVVAVTLVAIVGVAFDLPWIVQMLAWGALGLYLLAIVFDDLF